MKTHLTSTALILFALSGFLFPLSPRAKGIQPPLTIAAQKGETETAKTLLEQGAKIDETNVDGYTPLMLACFFGHLETAKLLVEKGAAVNYHEKSAPNYTPLICAAMNGHESIVELLLSKGADATMQDSVQSTALDRARNNGHKKIVALLQAALKKGKEP